MKTYNYDNKEFYKILVYDKGKDEKTTNIYKFNRNEKLNNDVIKRKIEKDIKNKDVLKIEKITKEEYIKIRESKNEFFKAVYYSKIRKENKFLICNAKNQENANIYFYSKQNKNFILLDIFKIDLQEYKQLESELLKSAEQKKK